MKQVVLLDPDVLGLTEKQREHVLRVFPEVRYAMANYLRQGVAVRVQRQNECSPDVPPYAIVVESDPEFWIDCAESPVAAKAHALALGLRVI
ncbi:hypothetical protein [Azotobacter beijerinckii]|nr:hypothetical protein [Azotobacter beijerinckii]